MKSDGVYDVSRELPACKHHAPLLLDLKPPQAHLNDVRLYPGIAIDYWEDRAEYEVARVKAAKLRELLEVKA
jgi:hypothetical protein